MIEIRLAPESATSSRAVKSLRGNHGSPTSKENEHEEICNTSVLFVTAAVIGFAAQAARAQVSVNVTIGGFYDELAPYGRWVDCRYGQCWVPAQVAVGLAAVQQRPMDLHGIRMDLGVQ